MRTRTRVIRRLRRLRRRPWGLRVATWYLRPLPDFVVIGAQRAGSTSLYRNLCAHPQVCAARKKEVHYFDFQSHVGPWWYRAHFPTSIERGRVERRTGAPSVTGEATPYYLFHPRVPERMASVLADVRLLAILRDPVERAISHYHWQVRRGHETRSMEEAFAADRERQARPPPPDAPGWDDRSTAFRRFSYLARGHYAEQLARWREAFDPSRMLVIDSEVLSRDGGGGFARVLAFLELESWSPPSFDDFHVSSYPEAGGEVRASLARYFEPHNERLWQLLGARWDWTRPPDR